MSFSRGPGRFFDDPQVHRLIDRLADQPSLVIYAGAGVTIDRTGLSWQDLIWHLLKKHKPDPGVRDTIMKTNTPLQAASVVCQMYANKSDDWRVELGNDLRALLYEGQAWQQGELAKAVVNLAAAMTDRGRDYYLATTNYDEFIQKEMELLDASRVEHGLPSIMPSTSVLLPTESEPDFEVAQHTQPGQILHLHGYVPSRGAADTVVVLSERDYMESYPRSSAVLEELFRRNSVIIIGSSLDDPPLLSALANTVADGRDERVRVAVVPLQGLRFPVDGARFLSDVKESVAHRMALFHVEAVFPDFYAQVAQVMTEIKVSLNRRAPIVTSGHGVSPAAARYRKRLESWWRVWRAGNDGNGYKRQHEHHKLLCTALKNIKATLGIPHEETVKLEIWVRWDPALKPQLRLWASTTSLWRHAELMRTADIVADSDYASVKAFCVGRPGIHPSDSDRWKTYLSVPVRTGEDSGDLPVGVISLASMLPADRSRISGSNGRAISRIIVTEMLPVAERITIIAE